MFLKSIELFGFKSFADRSKIDFTEGISALLGPNGCGKSNVVDALKWVLGEQATKSLRAERMEDVIFNGTEARKALGLAEVTLTLSNESGVLPLEMPEISIKRRLYRSGESEYSINGTPARLKDVRELFFDTGIGKTAYSIMEQGKIDQVLSNKPEERRNIFEEAAGITKYKIRGAEAERKLEKTDENMIQVGNIMKEVKRSHDSLKIQAEKTARYRTLREETFKVELDINLLRLKRFVAEKNDRETQLEKKSEHRDVIKKKIDGINENLEENLDLVNTMESKLIQTQKELYGVDLEKNSLERQLLLLKERFREIELQIESNISREKALKDNRQGIQDQQEEKHKLEKEMESRLEEVNRNISEFESNIGKAAERIQENECSVDHKQQEIKEAEELHFSLQDELRNITDDIVRELDLRLKETGYSYNDRKEIEESLVRDIDTLVVLLSGKKAGLDDLRTLQDLPLENIANHLSSVSASVDEYFNLAKNIQERFGHYKTSIPSFIDDFLSPKGIITKKRTIDLKIEEVRKRIQSNRDDVEKLIHDTISLTKKIEDYRKTLEELRINRERLSAQRSGLKDAILSLNKQIGDMDRQIIDLKGEIKSANHRLDEIKRGEEVYLKEKAAFEEKEASLKKSLATLEKGITDHNRELIKKEKNVKSLIGEMEKTQSQVEKLQISLASLETEIRNVQENFRDRHSRDLMEFESDMYEISRPMADLRNDLQRVKNELKDIGQVNLMAPEEFEEVKERYEFLTHQMADLSKAKEDLKIITREIRTESTDLFLATYDKIRKNFHSMFRRLFGGGRAELKLTDPEAVLESGIEIFAQPPGKKLENIALLSGGERSLTAVALLFATYMVKPSPFCVLDEIDAALDEENIGRFINILNEFGKTSQFIIITHNKKTVAVARTLLGITMAESGVSQVISVRLESPAVHV